MNNIEPNGEKVVENFLDALKSGREILMKDLFSNKDCKYSVQLDSRKLNPQFPYKLEKAHWYLMLLWKEGILTTEEFDRAMLRLQARMEGE